MAVMHPRVAHNYLKDGYYPTDEATLTLIAKRLRFKAGTQRLLDPCCGEGQALAKLAADIDAHPQSALHTYGVELDARRAENASQCLDTVLRSNAFDTVIGAGSQSLLFLNPPYGDAVSDQIENQQRDMARLEVQFIQRLLPTLKRDGVLVLVVPFPSLTPALCRYLSLRLREVQVFKASTDRFKQVVLLGRKADLRGSQHQTAFLHHGGLWPTFDTQFNQARHQRVPRPLRKLSPWHLSLSLAAGQIAGKVVSNDGTRTLLVKGGTQKVQRTVTSIDEHQTITTKIDQFQPLIRAIDLTPGERFGHIVIIQ